MRAVIWDLGGTLANTYPDVDRALAAVISAEPGESLLQEVAQLTRRSSGEAISTLARRHAVSEHALREAYDGTKARWVDQPPPVMDGAREVLAAVGATGGLNLVATHRERDSAEALLDSLGLAVDDLVCAPDGYARKPDPAMVHALLGRHHLEPGECLAVGDRPADLEAARSAGVPGVLLRTPGVPLRAVHAEHIDHLSELLVLRER